MIERRWNGQGNTSHYVEWSGVEQRAGHRESVMECLNKLSVAVVHISSFVAPNAPWTLLVLFCVLFWSFIIPAQVPTVHWTKLDLTGLDLHYVFLTRSITFHCKSKWICIYSISHISQLHSTFLGQGWTETISQVPFLFRNTIKSIYKNTKTTKIAKQ